MSSQAVIIVVLLCGLLLAGGILAVWFAFGPGPRRRRAINQVRQLLRDHSWRKALHIVESLQRQPAMAPGWKKQVLCLRAECHKSAGEELLKGKQFEAGLEQLKGATFYLHQAGEKRASEQDLRAYVADIMLLEARRILATNSQADYTTVASLLERIQKVCSPCPEASFWQAINLLKAGRQEDAVTWLLQARGAEASDLRSVLAASAENGQSNLAQAENTDRPLGKRGTKLEPSTSKEQSNLAIPLERGGPGAVVNPFIDPPLYLGALLLRLGKPAEAIHFLSEANRLDPNCPFVPWQLSMAMLAAGGDTTIAVRAMQRALGPRGFQQWVARPQRLWIEAFPEKSSYIRRLASKHSFECPLFGNDVAAMIRQGQINLGEGLYRAGQFEESAQVFHHLLQESAPTLPVLRGLGLALARLNRFDDAFKHLRAAHEMEEPKDHLTAGYLAMCGALGKPTRPEDKVRNVSWALRLACRFHPPADVEWADILKRIVAEARSLDMPIAVEEQVRLCDLLVTVGAADPLAAGAFAHLAATFGPPFVYRPEYAWLYCRAAQQHHLTTAQDLDLFGQTFATRSRAKLYYQERLWNFDDLEFAFLERCAQLQPGAFPAALEDPDNAGRGEQLLLSRARWLEQNQELSAASQSLEVLLKLSPANITAHDQLARLMHRAGGLERTATLLRSWHHLQPLAHLPLIRLAVVEQQRGQPARRSEAIRLALERTEGIARADIAFLGARLAIQDWFAQQSTIAGNSQSNGRADHLTMSAGASRAEAVGLLRECLHVNADHEEALWCLATLALSGDDQETMIELAPIMQARILREEEIDARFLYLAAICLLMARQYAGAGAAAVKASQKDSRLVADCAYVQGLSAIQLGDPLSASTAFEKPASESQCGAHEQAKAWLGQLALDQGDLALAITWWCFVDSSQRAAWGLDAPLSRLIFTRGVEALHEGKFEEAVGRLREARRLGLLDDRLEPLLTLALAKAGQRLLYS